MITGLWRVKLRITLPFYIVQCFVMHFTAVWEATVKMATDRQVCFQSSKQHHVSGWSTARQTACGRWVRKTDSYRVTQFVQKYFALIHCIIVTAGPQALDVRDSSTLDVLQTRYNERSFFAVSPTFENIGGRQSVLPFLIIQVVCYLLYKYCKKLWHFILKKSHLLSCLFIFLYTNFVQ